MRKSQISASMMCSNLVDLQAAIDVFEKEKVEYLHIDVMDGQFVPNLTFGAPVVKSLRKRTEMFFDCHLMVENPENYVDSFAAAGADLICVHAEATHHLHRLLQSIHSKGIQAGVALNPATPLCQIEEILPYADMILIMSVNPGFGGQKFIPTSVDKIRRLKQMIRERDLKTLIEVDGGVNGETAKACREAGADVLVAGSFVFGAADMQEAIAALR